MPSPESMLVHAPFPIEGRRLLLLAEGCFTTLDAKTAACVAMYRARDVVAVLDASRAGRTVHETLGFGGDAPVVATIEEALARRPQLAVVGTAPAGGELDTVMRAHVARCLEAGLDVASGMHAFLADDPALAALARASGARIWDIRRVPEVRAVSNGAGCTTGARVVLTVGTDCNVGKMTVALELDRAARAGGVRSTWAATGQTGILLRGRGVPVDRVVADFVGGATQELVDFEGRDADVVIVEGQGSITHPGYAGVTLGLLYGAMPDAMVLVHTAGRERYKRFDHAIPPLPEVVALYESLMRPYKTTRVVAIALNTRRLTPDDARRALERASDDTGLP
ncbi:MAG: DUF1611 domain-containing protein, partial [Candidatus Latescibacteria bacterium]|nr:DUF1611 domain-containing protein [Candidatus Latescibacterota bacterium]